MGPEHTPPSSADWSDALDRYYAGECRADERAAVEAYLAPRPRIARFFYIFRQVLDGTTAGAFDATSSLQRIKRVPNQSAVVQPQERRPSIRSGSWPRSTAPSSATPRHLVHRRRARGRRGSGPAVGWNSARAPQHQRGYPVRVNLCYRERPTCHRHTPRWKHGRARRREPVGRSR